MLCASSRRIMANFDRLPIIRKLAVVSRFNVVGVCPAGKTAKERSNTDRNSTKPKSVQLSRETESKVIGVLVLLDLEPSSARRKQKSQHVALLTIKATPQVC